MYCTECGKCIPEAVKFCPYCGIPITEKQLKLVCPDCGWSTTEDRVYCGNCGMLLLEHSQNITPLPAARDPAPHDPAPRDPAPRVYKFWSLYDGAPVLAAAKATGTLRLYDDRIEFEKKLGNSLGSVFGVVGLAVARNRMKAEPLEIFRIQNLTKVEVGLYAKVFNAVYLESTDHTPVTLVPPVPASTEPNAIVNRIQQLLNWTSG